MGIRKKLIKEFLKLVDVDDLMEIDRKEIRIRLSDGREAVITVSIKEGVSLRLVKVD